MHASGRHARRIVEESRETIAQALGCRPGEVVFTSGGTEADNLAVKGIHWARLAEDPRRTRILASAVEHHAVLDPLDWLRDAEGVEVELLPVDDKGRLVVDALREAVERDPASVSLISVMWANNEVGTLQPVEEVVAIAAEHGIPVHTDAVQAVGAVPVDFAASGVDALTPHRAQARRAVRRGRADRAPRGRGDRRCVHGGGQERDIRSGTIDTPAIAGFAAAVELRGQGAGRATPPGSGRSATTWSGGSSRWCPTRTCTAVPSTRSACTGCPATPTSASPAARATRC